MSKLQIGTSGWVYKHWIDIFYPPHLPSGEQLSFYAQHFATVEINFSFYRLPERSVFETWRKQTPSNTILDFRFWIVKHPLDNCFSFPSVAIIFQIGITFFLLLKVAAISPT